MKRRKFLGWALLGSIFSYLITFGQKTQSLAQNNNSHNQDYIAIGNLNQLKKDGQILNEDSPVGAVLVMFAPDNAIIAIDPTCTHAGCIVELKQQQKAFICPCHQSKFSLKGDVIEGLAKESLKKYQVKINDNQILVKL